MDECSEPDCDMLVEGIFCRWHNRRLPQPRVSQAPISNTDDRVTNNEGECFYCGEVEPLTRDHIIPQALGGQFRRPWNVVWACDWCNRKKAHYQLADWLRAMNRGRGTYKYDRILGRSRSFVTQLLTDPQRPELRRYRRHIDPWFGDEPGPLIDARARQAALGSR